MDKTAIYKYIDEKGIPYRKMSSIMSINVDEYNHVNVDKNSYNFIQLCLPFFISEQEQINLVLDYIYDLTSFRVKNVNDLLKLKSLNNKPFILEILGKNLDYENKLYVAFRKIPGSLEIRGDQPYKDNGIEITTLGNIELVDGDLRIFASAVQDMGNLKVVNGDLLICGDAKLTPNHSGIDSLSPLEKVQGGVMIRGDVRSLGTLKYVGQNLSLRSSKVIDLGELAFVGKNVLISKYHESQYDFSKIKIGGKIMRYNDKVETILD